MSMNFVLPLRCFSRNLVSLLWCFFMKSHAISMALVKKSLLLTEFIRRISQYNRIVIQDCCCSEKESPKICVVENYGKIFITCYICHTLFSDLLQTSLEARIIVTNFASHERERKRKSWFFRSITTSTILSILLHNQRPCLSPKHKKVHTQNCHMSDALKGWFGAKNGPKVSRRGTSRQRRPARMKYVT